MNDTHTRAMFWTIISVIAAASILPWETSGTSERVNSSFEFIFRREECLKGYASDSNNAGLFGELHINSSSVICKGLGVEAKPNILVDQRVVSTLDSSRFVEEIDNRRGGWTFEIWAIFQNFSECPMCHSRQIASISTNEDMTKEDCSTTSNMVFLQTNLGQSVVMQDSTILADKSCSTMEASSVVDWGVPAHAVFTSTSSELQASSTSDDPFHTARTTCWYINGLQVGCDWALNQASQWQDGFYLQMLNDAVAVGSLNSTSASSAGCVFLVAMYNRALSEAEVMQNFDAGLENSPPVAEDIVITINEDGEIGDHYDTPALYLQDPMVLALNLPVILLLATDIDQQVGFPGFDAEKLVLPDVYIDSLPSKGTLHDVYGQPIKHVPHYVAFDGGYPVRYRPYKDEYSGPKDVYTSFTYNAVDGVTGATSVVPGIVGIHVLPKNDPPLPSNISATIPTGETLLFLGGTDVDSAAGDAIVGFLVVEPPSHGVLHQVSLVRHTPISPANGEILYESLKFLTFVVHATRYHTEP